MPAGHHRIALPGEWDIARCDGLRRRLAAAAAANDTKLVVIDLRESQFGDSSPLHVLEEVTGQLSRNGVDFMTIVGRQSLPHRMMRITALEERLGVVATTPRVAGPVA